MARGELDRLLEAEKEAQRTIEMWRERAKKAVSDSNSDALSSKEEASKQFRAKLDLELEQMKKDATTEAEKIKRDGAEMAAGLKEKGRKRVPNVVEHAVEILFQEH
ncbi:MAG: hypothetical protein LUQ69_10255 [Methanoregulaceae archaeon]|nr:hypothetical protein [Methanoregulaceae archaeon]